MVQIDRYYPGIKANYIVVDNYKSSAETTEELIRKGCRRIAFVCYDINMNTLTDRRRVCTDVLERHGLYDASLVKIISYENQEEEKIHLWNAPKPASRAPRRPSGNTGAAAFKPPPPSPWP